MAPLCAIIVIVTFSTCVIFGNCQQRDAFGGLHIPSEEGRCTEETLCEPLINRTCLGAPLPYTHTSIKFAKGQHNQNDIQAQLKSWERLANIPKCWEEIRVVLCSVYMPKCTPKNLTRSFSPNLVANRSENVPLVGLPGVVELPSHSLCELTREPCSLISAGEHGWPDVLDCDQQHFTLSPCYRRKLPFEQVRQCKKPLVVTDKEDSWYSNVEGCGVQCANPLYTEQDHAHAHFVILICAIVCIICNIFTLLTFMIDWSVSSSYPSIILFYINCCFFCGCLGWLAQFIPSVRQDIVCKRDGTIRSAEPQIASGESVSCTVIFTVIYFSLMASVIWFTLLAFSWHLRFKALGSGKNVIRGKKGTFHLIAWCAPLVLVIVCMAMTQIDGDSLSGICFVGTHEHTYRVLLVLIPIGLTALVGIFFIFCVIKSLLSLHVGASEEIGKQAATKIRQTLIRQGIFVALVTCWILVMVLAHLYIFLEEPKWKDSFNNYIICDTNIGIHNTTQPTCTYTSKPQLWIMELHIAAYFGAGITMSSWVWTKTSMQIWKNFILRTLHIGASVESVKEPALEGGANLRKPRPHSRRQSTSMQSNQDDLMGLNFGIISDFDSVTTCDLSSTWMADMTGVSRVIRRSRNSIAANHRQRRYSDSDVGSVSIDQFTSIDSLQNCTEVTKRQRRKRHKSRRRAYHYERQSQCASSLSGAESEAETSFIKKKHQRKGKKVRRVTPLDPSAIIQDEMEKQRKKLNRSNNNNKARTLPINHGMTWSNNPRRISNASSGNSMQAPSVQMSWDNGDSTSLDQKPHIDKKPLPDVISPNLPSDLLRPIPRNDGFSIFTASSYTGSSVNNDSIRTLTDESHSELEDLELHDIEASHGDAHSSIADDTVIDLRDKKSTPLFNQRRIDVSSINLEDSDLPYLLPGQVQDDTSHWKKPTETVTEIDLSDDLSEISLK